MLSPWAGEALTAAAEDLATVLEAAKGERPKVIRSRLCRSSGAIFIGESRFSRRALPLPHALEWSDSVWRKDRKGRILLRGATEEALVDGIYTFAREYYGARWFLPNMPVHFVEAARAEAAWGPQAQLMQPAFQGRQVVGFDNLDGGAHSRRSRFGSFRAPFQFEHALSDVFTSELYAQRPELFSTRGGRQQPPRGSNQFDPQPHLALPAAAEHAAEAALAYFQANPEAASFSLGGNDNILYDETALTRALVEPIEWFRGLPNYSDLVFTFMNRVAEQVFDQAGAWETPSGRPRYLTALAYYWAEQVPSFPLHPRVLPILTADRAQWHDPEYEQEDKALIEAWGRSGAEILGTWDYYMGPPLPYPRQYVDEAVESVRHLSDNGVEVFYTAMPFVLGFHGAKAYLLSELLWDPDQDADKLQAEFYEGVFGPAADTMATFYEAFATERRLREGPGQWLKFYLDEACIELFTEEFLEEMALLLEQAAQEAATDAEALARIQEVQANYQLTLDYAAYQKARRELVLISVGDQVLPEQLVEALLALTDAKAALEARLEILFELPRYHRNFSWMLPDSAGQSQPLALAIGRLPALKVDDLARLQERFPDWAEWLSGNAGQDNLVVEDQLIANPRLEHSDIHDDGRYLMPQPMPQIPGWQIAARPAQRFRVSQSEGAWYRGLRTVGADIVTLFTRTAVAGGEWHLLAADLELHASPDNRTDLKLSWYDHDGQHLHTEEVFQAPTQWPERPVPQEMRLRIPVKAPEAATSLRVRFAASRQYPGDYLEIHQVRLFQVQE